MLPIRARDLCVVRVYDDIEQAVKTFRKQVEKSKVLKEIRDRKLYITRAERRALKDQRALRRIRKARRGRYHKY